MKALEEVAKFFIAMQMYLKPENWVITFTKGCLSSAADFLNNNSFIETTYDALVPVGIGIALIVLICKMIDSTITKEITFDDWVRAIVLFCVHVLLLKNGYDILYSFVKAGETISLGFSDAIQVAEMTASSVDINIVASFWDILMSLLFFFFFLPFIIIFSVAIYLVMLVRTAEIGVYTCLAPIGLYDMTTDIANSNALRFLKRYAALAIQGIVIVAVVYLGEQMAFPSFNNLGGLELFISSPESQDLAAALVEDASSVTMGVSVGNWCMGFLITSFIFKSKQIAKDIMGVD